MFDILVGEQEVQIFLGKDLIARHARSSEPHSKVTDPAHYKGLWHPQKTPVQEPSPIGGLAVYGRSLADYEAALLPEVTA
jgi:hypothetical protein